MNWDGTYLVFWVAFPFTNWMKMKSVTTAAIQFTESSMKNTAAV
jgi:hypothetical protein